MFSPKIQKLGSYYFEVNKLTENSQEEYCAFYFCCEKAVNVWVITILNSLSSMLIITLYFLCL